MSCDLLILLCALGMAAGASQPLSEGLTDDLLFRDAQEKLIIPCNAVREPEQKIFWSLNEAAVQTDSRITQNPDGSLNIANPTIKDEGVYQCSVETAIGTASSLPISVRRSFLVAPTTVPLNRVKATEGLPFHITCERPEGYPKPEVYWIRQDFQDYKKTASALDHRITKDPTGTLWFSTVQAEDVSKNMAYACVAKVAGFDEEVVVARTLIDSLEAGKEIRGAPIAQYLTPDNYIGLTGTTTELYCLYGGHPLVAPDWFKNGKSLNGNAHDARITRHNRTYGKRLLIRKTVAEDQGVYSCEVNNGVEVARHSINLKIDSPPAFTQQPKSVSSTEGTPVTIECQVSGAPKPEISWTFNGKPLAKDARIKIADSLIIEKSMKSDSGIYGCKASNSRGKIYAEVPVVIA